MKEYIAPSMLIFAGLYTVLTGVQMIVQNSMKKNGLIVVPVNGYIRNSKK